MNEKEKRQGTLIFFIVESLLTAFAFKIFKRQARQAGKAWVKSPIFLPNSNIQPSSHSTKNPSSAFIIKKISFFLQQNISSCIKSDSSSSREIRNGKIYKREKVLVEKESQAVGQVVIRR
jgi:hypothetical protein